MNKSQAGMNALYLSSESMTHAEHQLYRKIVSFRLDQPGVKYPLSVQLAWNYRWTALFTHRAIAEYKRFAFLVVATGKVLSPSSTVDRVWHQHLLYTEPYWNDFCPNILGQPLHHRPDGNGRPDGIRFYQRYCQTIEAYRTYFGDPPDDIWHAPRRQLEPFTYQWIDRERYWLITKPKHLMRRREQANENKPSSPARQTGKWHNERLPSSILPAQSKTATPSQHPE